MNYSSVIGSLAALAVVILGIITSSKSAHVFLDLHGILIVLGGTAAAGLMCFPLHFYKRIMKVFVSKFLGKYSTRFDIVISELVDLAKGLRENPDYMNQKVKTLKTPFLADAVQLMALGGINEESLDEILVKRAVTHSKRYDYDANVFKTLAKFPPAFGLLGTTLGMITLLQQLGGNDAQKMLGPAMAVGLVATFYGLILANLVLIPIGENLSVINRDDETVRTIVIDGLRLIRKKEHPKIVEEHLKSYLLPSERALLGIVKGKKS